MQSLLPVFVVLVLLALLLPPALFLATALKMRMRSRRSSRSPVLVICSTAALIAVLFNTVFVLLRFGEILSASLTPNAYLTVAVLASWFSFFGRIALKSTSRHKRRLSLRAGTDATVE